jgi:uncharacterized protein (TIGR03086 family)
MSEVSVRYSVIARGFTTRLEGVPADGWSVQTPCAEWTVRDLVAHVVTAHRRVLATLDRSEPEAVAADSDLFPAWTAASKSVLDALNDPAKASKIVNGPVGEQAFESLVGALICADTLVHTWDLARATGQDERLDAYAVAKAAESVAVVGEFMRRPGGFAPKVESAPDADEQTKLLNFCGRAV